MEDFLRLSGPLQATMLAIGLAPSALLAVLGFIFRERLKHALAKSLNAQTEQLKLEAQREIEAYKVTLIASVERQKAQAELIKAIAIKHATLEYEALVLLHARLAEVPTEVLSVTQRAPPGGRTEEQRIQDCSALLKKLQLLFEAAEGAHLFTTPQQNLAALDLRDELLRLVNNHLNKGLTHVPSDEERKAINSASAKLRNSLRDRVTSLIQFAEGQQSI